MVYDTLITIVIGGYFNQLSYNWGGTILWFSPLNPHLIQLLRHDEGGTTDLSNTARQPYIFDLAHLT